MARTRTRLIGLVGLLLVAGCGRSSILPHVGSADAGAADAAVETHAPHEPACHAGEVEWWDEWSSDMAHHCYLPCEEDVDCPPGQECKSVGWAEGGDWQCNRVVHICAAPADFCDGV